MNVAKRRKQFKRAPGAQPFALQDRDVAVLKLVYDLRFAYTQHIVNLVPGSNEWIKRRLRKLFDEGYLDRPPKQGARAKGKNFSLVYALGARGAELLKKEHGIDHIRGDWTKKNREASYLTIQHQLLIAEFRTALVLALKQNRAGELIFWRQSHELLDHALWHGRNGRQQIPVYPDAWFAIKTEAGKTRHFFLEADNSTMRHERYHKKMTGYFWYWMAGQSAYGRQYGRKKGLFNEADPFRVLTIAKTAVRTANLFDLAKEMGPKKIPTSMFWFLSATGYDLDDPGRILGEIWKVWTKDGKTRKMALV